MDFGAIHAASIVVIVVVPVGVPVHELMRVQRLIGIERVSHKVRNRLGRDVHLGVGGVAVALREKVVEQIGRIVFSRLATGAAARPSAVAAFTTAAAVAAFASAAAISARTSRAAADRRRSKIADECSRRCCGVADHLAGDDE